MTVAVLIPVLNRPERVEPLLASLYSSWEDEPLRPMFLVTQGDTATLDALSVAEGDPHVMVLPGPREPGDYARKMNHAIRHLYREGAVDWAFLGADDLCFCHGWADRAIDAADDAFDVVGTNDLGNPEVTRGQHSTHSLVRVSYLMRGTIDEPRTLLHEGYRHNWVDTEFVQTAQKRGAYIKAFDSMVEHLHPHWGKGELDATYQLGLADYDEDRRLFLARRRLWG